MRLGVLSVHKHMGLPYDAFIPFVKPCCRCMRRKANLWRTWLALGKLWPEFSKVYYLQSTDYLNLLTTISAK